MDRESQEFDRRRLLAVCAAWVVGAALPDDALARVARTAASGLSEELFNRVDREFLRSALRTSRADQALSRLALRKAARPHVRDFARRLATDHGKVQSELRRFALRRRIALASRPGDPVPARARALQGAAFDRDYMARMYRDTREAIVLFQREAREGADPELKAYATANLPMLRTHLKLAQQGDPAWRADATASPAARLPDPAR